MAPLICFNGIDGSGKSTQALRLVEWLNAAGCPAVYRWCGGRTSFTRPFTLLVKGILGGGARPSAPSAGVYAAPSTDDSPYLSRTARILGNRRVRNLWLLFSLYEHAAKIWVKVLPPLLRGQVVICDRYIYDTVVTTALLAGVAAEDLPVLLRLPPGCRVPRPTLWFFLDLPAEVAQQRKLELSDIVLLRRRIALYRQAANLFGMECIDATVPPEEVTAVIGARVAALLPSVE